MSKIFQFKNKLLYNELEHVTDAVDHGCYGQQLS